MEPVPIIVIARSSRARSISHSISMCQHRLSIFSRSCDSPKAITVNLICKTSECSATYLLNKLPRLFYLNNIRFKRICNPYTRATATNQFNDLTSTERSNTRSLNIQASIPSVCLEQLFYAFSSSSVLLL